MAIVTGAGENYLSISGVPSTSAFTIMASVFLRSDANAYSVLFGLNGGANHPLMSINSDGVTAELGDGNADYLSSFALSVGSWAHLCWRRTSTSNNEQYANGELVLTTASQDIGTGATNLFIGRYGDTGQDPFNAGATRLYGIKIWDVALSPEEIAIERFFVVPKRRANLWAWLPCNTGGVIGADWSGNGRNATVIGTVTEEDSAPVSWGASNLFVPSFVSAPSPQIASPSMLLACFF
jgi:hypothetical protein